MVYQFEVEPNDVDMAARQLWKLSEDNPQAVSYAKEWLELEGSSGEILKPFIEGLHKSCEQLQSNYEELGRVTDSSSTELTNTANMYRTTDRAFAETLDRTYNSESDK